MDIQICVGSSCHVKGSEAIVERLQQALADNNMEGDINLSGSFCTGQCNRTGVTITVDEETFTGITTENFTQFFQNHILAKHSK